MVTKPTNLTQNQLFEMFSSSRRSNPSRIMPQAGGSSEDDRDGGGGQGFGVGTNVNEDLYNQTEINAGNTGYNPNTSPNMNPNMNPNSGGYNQNTNPGGNQYRNPNFRQGGGPRNP